jgi:hypothetical protein
MATKKSKSEAPAPTQPAKVQKKVATPKSPAKAQAPAAKPSAAPKAATTKPAKSKAVLTNEAIALRAYFIAEERYRTKTPGSSTEDWLEAERQLLAEAAGSAKAKKTPTKSAK